MTPPKPQPSFTTSNPPPDSLEAVIEAILLSNSNAEEDDQGGRHSPASIQNAMIRQRLIRSQPTRHVHGARQRHQTAVDLLEEAISIVEDDIIDDDEDFQRPSPSRSQ